MATVASSYKDETRGPLSGIEAAASKEIAKLWTNWENRTDVKKQGYTFATLDQVNALINPLSTRIDNITVPAPAASQIIAGSGGGATGAGSADLRPLDNTWTGSNVWSGGEVPGKLRNRFLGLTSGAITAFTPVGDSVNMESTNYQTLVDIQKTSDASVFGGKVGGNAGLFVQHRTGGTATTSHLAWGIRAHAETYAIAANGQPNHIAAGYFIGHNAGTGSLGHGLRVEMWHKAAAANGVAHSYGVEVTMLRAFPSGKTAAFSARAGAFASYNQAHDFAFVALGGGSRFNTVFAAGADGLGNLDCDIGMDLSHASCNVAAISLPANRPILMDGSGAAFIYYQVPGVFQLKTGGSALFSFGSSGDLFVHQANLTGGPLPGDPPNVVDNWVVYINGFPRRIALK